MAQTFDHEGVTYTVRAQTALEADLLAACLWDLLDLIASERGQGEDYQSIPRIYDKAAVYFIRWGQVTTTDQPVPWQTPLYPVTHIDAFYAFIDAITGSELGDKWKAAYEAENKTQADPEAERAVEAPASTS